MKYDIFIVVKNPIKVAKKFLTIIFIYLINIKRLNGNNQNNKNKSKLDKLIFSTPSLN
ncbi:MAG: hypothetical protein AWL62_2089 [Halanaerobium sp. T82-1]|jgi:hypothetical protein|nr:MAG: hypothetical protein AWL62_2089 [Halanaerobium sp. T82-1]